MRVVVLGGGGLTGRVAVRALAESDAYDEVVAADVDPTAAAAAAHAAGPKAHPVTVDVRDPASLDAALHGSRFCVNAVQYAHNVAVMEAALRVGIDCLDFGGLFHTTRRQLELDERFRSAGRLAIPGLGQVPGISNVLVAAATVDLEAVDSVEIRDGWRDATQGAPPIVFTWSPSTFLDEMLLPAVAWEAGAYREFPPMSDPEEYDFGPGVGVVRLYRTIHSEPATLPGFLAAKGVQRVAWREGGEGIDVLRILAQLGLGDERPVPVRGSPVAPREFLLALLRDRKLLGYPPSARIDDIEVTDVEIRGRRNGALVQRHATATFRARPDWHASATEYAVGIAGAAGAILHARGAITAKGVVPPESSVPATPYFEELSRWGIRVDPGTAP